MSKTIREHNVGDCVEVSTWVHDDCDGFFIPCQAIGLVLGFELVDMAEESEGYEKTAAWLYRVTLPDGRITEAWDYEIKHVNSNQGNYNIISHQPKGE